MIAVSALRQLETQLHIASISSLWLRILNQSLAESLHILCSEVYVVQVLTMLTSLNLAHSAITDKGVVALGSCLSHL